MDRVAMVGTPCQIHTVRKMQALGIIPSDVIKYCFGLFCMENFSFDDIQLKHLEKQYGFDLPQVLKVNVKEDFFIYLRDGRVIHIPFAEIDSIARPACLVCPDFSAEFSDLSFGGLGSPEGYTTVLIRSEKGKLVYRGALTAGYIKERRYSFGEQARSDLIRLQRLVVDFSQRKKERALKNRGAGGGLSPHPLRPLNMVPHDLSGGMGTSIVFYSTRSKLILSFLGISFLVCGVALLVGGQLLYKAVLNEATPRPESEELSGGLLLLARS